MGGIVIPLFQVNVDAITPRILLHDTDQLRQEHILRPVRIIPQCFEDTVRSVIGYRQQPFDVGPFIDVCPHNRTSSDGNTALIDFPCGTDLKRKESDLADTVTVITERLIHPGIAHECPHHNCFAFQ